MSEETTTREEHLAWCKRRALELVDAGEPLTEAFTSMLSDLGKHEETRNCRGAVELGYALLLGGTV